MDSFYKICRIEEVVLAQCSFSSGELRQELGRCRVGGPHSAGLRRLRYLLVLSKENQDDIRRLVLNSLNMVMSLSVSLSL